MKKVLSLVLALLMCVSIATTAMAAPGKRPGKEDNKPVNTQQLKKTKRVGFYISFTGAQLDEEGNIETRDTSYFSDMVGKTTLKDNLDNDFAIVIGSNATEEDVISYLVDVPDDKDVFAKLYDYFKKSDKHLSTSGGEAIGWDELAEDKYEVEWYVLKRENDHWHVDGRIHEIGSDEEIIIIPPAEEEEEDEKEDEEEDKDPPIVLDGIDYAYIFGYEPVIKTVDGKVVAEIEMGMDDKVTVEQVSSMLMRMLDQHGDTTDVVYPMVPAVEPHEGQWYARGLLYLCSVGGFDADETIRLEPITRGHVAKLVACALRLNQSKETPFTDIADNKYKEYIEIVYNYGYMNGVGDDKFAPDAYMTRAEFCTLFNNIIGRNEKGLIARDAEGNEYKVTAETYYFVDMDPSHWAYEICLKATSAYDAEGYVDIDIRLDNIRNKLDHYNSQLHY